MDLDPGHGKQQVDNRLLRKPLAIQDGGPDMVPRINDKHHQDLPHQAVNVHLANGLVSVPCC